MKIISLVDDQVANDLNAEHGLSIYVEFNDKRILIDTGKTSLFLENAKQLGVDISNVDTLIITHGHYDHGGGINAFLEANDKARVYIQKSAFQNFISNKNGEINYIGLDQSLINHPQIVLLDGDSLIENSIIAFTKVCDIFPQSQLNLKLFKEDNSFMCLDEFEHEQFILLIENGISMLFCGCAHKGIANAIERAKAILEEYPMFVIGGFHIDDGINIESDEYISNLASFLLQCNSSFYTCHCSGQKGYAKLKEHLGEDINYLHVGDTISF